MIVNSKEMTISLPQKKLQSIKHVSGSASKSRNISFRVNKGARSPHINNFGHSTGKTPLLFSPTATNSGTEEKWFLQKSSVTEQRSLIGASLVGQKQRNIQSKDLNSTSSSSSFTDRCFTNRLGGSLGMTENWRDMDSAGEEDAHKQNGSSCIKSSPEILFESTGNRVTTYSDGQYSGPGVLSENGWHKKSTNVFSFQTNLGTAIKEKGNCDSRVPSQCNEQARRHRISSQDRFIRMAASPLSVSKTLCENGKAINRPLCFQGVSSASNICSLEERSIQCGNQCILNNLEQRVLRCIPSFLPKSISSEQDREEQNKKINFDNTMLADIVLVPPNIEHVNKETSNPSIIRKATN